MIPFLKDREPTASAWVLHVMSFAILLAWTELMLLMGRFPTCGYYALMFYHVLQNVIKVQYCYMNKIISYCHAIIISAQWHCLDIGHVDNMLQMCIFIHTCIHIYIYSYTHTYIHTFHGSLSMSQRQQDMEQFINTPDVHNLQHKVLQTLYKNSIINHLYT